jgi:hypothetical protein
MLLSYRLAMEHLCVLYLETALATLVTTWFTLADRRDLLEYKEEKQANKRVPLVLTYHPPLEKISGIVRHHWKEIDKSEMLTKLFPEPPVVAFRGPMVVKEVNHIRCFAIDIAKDIILLSCRLAMEHLCVLRRRLIILTASNFKISVFVLLESK